MYSKNEESYLKNIERESFRKLKEKENKNRSIPLSADILYISDFTIENFSNSDYSGNLHLATSV